MSLLFHKTGIVALIQDRGRPGYRHWGVPESGPMDSISYELAHTLCGNNGDEALIEFTLHGAVIEFESNTLIALTGGGAQALVNEIPLAYHTAHAIKKGDLLKLIPHSLGCRTYLAVQGGLKITPDLGSCSSYLPAQLGGLNGQALKPGDRIEFNSISRKPSSPTQVEIKFDNPALYQNEIIVPIHQGPEWMWLDANMQSLFLQEKWRISPQSNRMGIQLLGVAIHKKEKKELLSTGVMPGIIQLTPAGIPIILGADAQTIGGYPRIARTTLLALSIIGQCRPGVYIQFKLAEESI